MTTRFRENGICWLLAAALGVIGLYAAFSVYARPIADDLCIARSAVETGIIGAVADSYRAWTGNVIGLYYQTVGAAWNLYSAAPLLILALFLTGFTWLAWEGLAAGGLYRSKPLALLVGALLTLGLIDMSPNLFQTLYWLNGTVNYAIASAFFLFLLALLLRVARLGASRTHLLSAVLLAFVIVCGQVTLVVYCIGLLVLSLIAAVAYRRTPHRGALIRTLVFALSAALLAAAVVVLAPGNDIRQSVLDKAGLSRQNVFDAALVASVTGFVLLVRTIIQTAPLGHLLLWLIGLIAGVLYRPPVLTLATLSPRTRRLVIPVGLLIGFALFYLQSYPVALTTGKPAPSRAWVVPQATWVLVVFLVGYLCGLYVMLPSARNAVRNLHAAAVFCIAAFLMVQVANAFAFLPVIREYAEDRDQRVALIEAALSHGEVNVLVPPYRTPIEQSVFLDGFLDRQCDVNFYGLESLTETQAVSP